MAMIFQEPVASLNPCFTVGRQIEESLETHLDLDQRARRARAIELLNLVGITEPERRLKQYPHQLSGGMCQRVMIAIAIACRPKLLIADEPTTALDVTIQAQILDLLLDLQRETGMALVLITHDMGVVAETADRVIVQYAGQQVEQQPVDGLFRHPRHPYTAALLAALPERSGGSDCRRSPASCPASPTGQTAACSIRAAALPPPPAARCRRRARRLPAAARRSATTRCRRPALSPPRYRKPTA